MLSLDSVRSRLRDAGVKIILNSPRAAFLLRMYRVLLDHAPHLMLASRFLSIVDTDGGRAIVLRRAGDARRASRKFHGLHSTAENHLLEWARLSYEDDRHAAARAARQWISAPGAAADVAVKTEAGSAPQLEIHLPTKSVVTHAQRLKIAQDAALSLWGYHEAADDGAPYKAAAESLILAIAQELSRTRDYDAAKKFLSDAISIRHSWFIEMPYYAVGLELAGGDIPPYIKQLLGEDVDYFRDKFCGRPFKELQIAKSGNVFACCPSYLPERIGNVRAEGSNAIINSKRAIKVRKSILDGKFTYCDWTKCSEIKNQRLPDRDAVSESAMRDAISKNTGVIDGPRHLVVAYDATCNLWCPSCRKSRITVKGREFDEIMRTTDKVVLPLFPHLNTIEMNNYGDIFSSRSCRHILNSVDPERFPQLKFRFVTNGVLLTEQEWEKFPNIHSMVQSINVSVNAATQPVYDKVRLGGDFSKLSRNLEFIARLRRSGVIKDFTLSFVVQRENFREMNAFVDWAERLGCDMVSFGPLLDWATFGRAAYEKNAVHLPAHPLYPEYRRMAELIADRASRAMAEGRSTLISSDFDL